MSAMTQHSKRNQFSLRQWRERQRSIGVQYLYLHKDRFNEKLIAVIYRYQQERGSKVNLTGFPTEQNNAKNLCRQWFAFHSIRLPSSDETTILRERKVDFFSILLDGVLQWCRSSYAISPGGCQDPPFVTTDKSHRRATVGEFAQRYCCRPTTDSIRFGFQFRFHCGYSNDDTPSSIGGIYGSILARSRARLSKSKTNAGRRDARWCIQRVATPEQ